MKRLGLDAVVFAYVMLFMYAATSKVIEFDTFQAQIGRSPLIMEHASFFAWVVPGLEIIISILLLVPKTQVLGFYCAFTLMSIFSIYILFILNFSPYVPCSCGGVLNNMGWTEHLLFNIGFVGLSILGIVLNNKQFSQKISFT